MVAEYQVETRSDVVYKKQTFLKPLFMFMTFLNPSQSDVPYLPFKD